MTHPPVSLDSIVKHFESPPDPRHTRNRLHLFRDAIALSVCGVIVGCCGPTSIERWAKAKQDWLETLLALPNGIPSRDAIRRVLSAPKPEAFQSCFQSWIAPLVNESADGRGIVAIDGKTMCRSHDQAGGLGPLHLVRAWLREQGLSSGQVTTEAKSHEVTAIPALIDRLDVKGAIVTIDAMGCQKEIIRKLVVQQGDYVLAVKENQPKLHQAIREIFSEQREEDLLPMPHRQHRTREKGHGRRDERIYVLAKIPRNFPLKGAWPSVKTIGMAVRVTEKKDGTTYGDVRYFIASRYLSEKRFAQAVRGHWGIENALHRVLDVTFERTGVERVSDTWQTISHGYAALRSACSSTTPPSTASKARAKSQDGATSS